MSLVTYDYLTRNAIEGLRITADDDAVLEVSFRTAGEIRERARPRSRLIGLTIERLDAYFAGERTDFELPTAFRSGTEFQRDVWRFLLEIPYGETRTYAEAAEAVGRPLAARAAGAAIGANPIAIVVPCHRVIGSSGALTGFGGGLGRKRFLLDLENALPTSPANGALSPRGSLFRGT